MHKLKITLCQLSYIYIILKDSSLIPGEYKRNINGVLAVDPKTGERYKQIFVQPGNVSDEVNRLVQWLLIEENRV